MKPRGKNLRKAFLRASLPVLRRLPPRAALRAVGQLGRLEYRLCRDLRAAFDEAIRRHAEHFGAAWDPRAIGPDLAANQVRSRARDLLIDGRDEAQIDGVYRITGGDRLEAAFAEGRGVVLLGNHFGAYLLSACWVIRRGYPWRMFGERPRHISRLLARQFAAEGPLGQPGLFISRRTDPAKAAGAILRASRVLRAGITLSIAADVRWNGPLTSPATFLGRRYRFSSTWVTLAALSGAPVVPSFCAMTPEGTYDLEFAAPFSVPRDAAKDPEAARVLVQGAIDLIEQRVRLNPANSIDYFFWDEDDAGGADDDAPALPRAG